MCLYGSLNSVVSLLCDPQSALAHLVSLCGCPVRLPVPDTFRDLQEVTGSLPERQGEQLTRVGSPQNHLPPCEQISPANQYFHSTICLIPGALQCNSNKALQSSIFNKGSSKVETTAIPALPVISSVILGKRSHLLSLGFLSVNRTGYVIIRAWCKLENVGQLLKNYLKVQEGKCRAYKQARCPSKASTGPE